MRSASRRSAAALLARASAATPAVLAALTALTALATLGCRDDDGVVPKGPGILPDAASVRTTVGGAARIGTTWGANAPVPRTFRIRWTVAQPAVAGIDSVSADTRTVYLRGRAVGSSPVSAVDSSYGAFTVSVTVE